jgi:UDP-N-acetylglucosamine 2-epimerase
MKKIHSKIAIVIGTKAELIKCMPIMKELQAQKKDYWFIHTGQHPLGKSCKEFNIKTPDFILSEEPKKSTKFWSKVNKFSLVWFFKMIFLVRKKIKEINPKYIIYHGDTMSTAAASIGASRFLNKKKKWKNVHLEAGLRSGSLFEPFPEEISRKIATKFSDVLFAVSDLTHENLLKIKSKSKIIKVGNTIVDSAYIVHKEAKKTFKPPKYKYALINIHRHENLRSKKRLKKIVEILKAVKIKAMWPLHDNTEYYLKKYNLIKEVLKIKNIIVKPLINYFDFIALLSHCEYVITDGGSIQEESLTFKKPCVLLRKKTERIEGLHTKINFLTKLYVNRSKELIKNIEDKKLKFKKFKNPYGKKGVSKKVVRHLK